MDSVRNKVLSETLRKNAQKTYIGADLDLWCPLQGEGGHEVPISTNPWVSLLYKIIIFYKDYYNFYVKVTGCLRRISTDNKMKKYKIETNFVVPEGP